jgi:hypothetical protein
MDLSPVILAFDFVAPVKVWPVSVAEAYDFCFGFWISMFAATRREYDLS